MSRSLPSAKLPEIGRIRMGIKTLSSRGKLIPQASSTLIFTSESKGTLGQLRERVGGEIKDFVDGPESWRLISTVSQLAVALPPQLISDPAFELWSAAGCLRRCDGETVEVPVETPDGLVLEQRPCMCGDLDTPCKITTRVRVVIPEVAGVGVWALTTHSEIAAAELAAQRQLLLAAATQLVPCTIAIEQEKTRHGGTVPVLRLRMHQSLNAILGSINSLEKLGSGSSS